MPKLYFERDSEVFRGLFTLPNNLEVPEDGSSDERPLRLEGLKEHDFRQLLKVMYPELVVHAITGHTYAKILDHTGTRVTKMRWTSQIGRLS